MHRRRKYSYDDDGYYDEEDDEEEEFDPSSPYAYGARDHTMSTFMAVPEEDEQLLAPLVPQVAALIGDPYTEDDFKAALRMSEYDVGGAVALLTADAEEHAREEARVAAEAAKKEADEAEARAAIVAAAAAAQEERRAAAAAAASAAAAAVTSAAAGDAGSAGGELATAANGGAIGADEAAADSSAGSGAGARVGAGAGARAGAGSSSGIGTGDGAAASASSNASVRAVAAAVAAVRDDSGRASAAGSEASGGGDDRSSTGTGSGSGTGTAVIRIEPAPEASELPSKALLNLVVVGHVDAGKSTLMGHLLVQLGYVDQRVMHRFTRDSKAIGKASFAFAWVLDRNEEERERGVTMDVAVNHFETEHRRFTLLDAPGHRDFIPNMISGASQADAAVLVVSAAGSEFEAGFGDGGQTKEHAVLIRALGVMQVVVAVNKMDMAGWDRARYDDICARVGGFLRENNFKDSRVRFVPVSGLGGENLAAPSEVAELAAWYTGPTLAQCLDGFAEVPRPVDGPLRLVVSDAYKSAKLGPVTVAGKVEAGVVRPGNRVVIMPSGELCAIKSIDCGGELVRVAVAGDNVDLGLGGVELSSLSVGHVLCSMGAAIPLARKVRARVFVLPTLATPIVKGQQLVAHVGNVEEPCNVTRLSSSKAKTGETTKHPRFLLGGVTADVKVKFARALPMETYESHRRLGRFLLRQGGVTVAAGMVLKILK